MKKEKYAQLIEKKNTEKIHKLNSKDDGANMFMQYNMRNLCSLCKNVKRCFHRNFLHECARFGEVMETRTERGIRTTDILAFSFHRLVFQICDECVKLLLLKALCRFVVVLFFAIAIHNNQIR